MNKLLIVTKREFLYRVKKKSFIIITALMPLLFALVMFTPILLVNMNEGSEHNVAVIDKTGKYASCFRDGDGWKFFFPRTTVDDVMSDHNTYAVIEINKDPAQAKEAIDIYSRNEVSASMVSMVRLALTEKVRTERLAAYNIPNLEQIIKESDREIEMRTIRFNDSDKSWEESNPEIPQVIGIMLTLLIYMFILTYGSMVMQSVTEEKSSRIVEVIISSVKPFTLMLGKVLGIMLTGLFQIMIWGIMAAWILIIVGIVIPKSPTTLADMDVQNISGILSTLFSMNWIEITVLFILFFVGGYLLYASFFAAVGASVSSQEDIGQFVLPVTVVMIFALYVGIACMNDPDSNLAFWCSMIPFTSPIVMIMRIPFGVPVWQELLSLLILFASALYVIKISGKIYRTGILLYGQKPGLKDIVKWMRKA